MVNGKHEPCSWHGTSQNTLSFLFFTLLLTFDAPPCAQAEKKKKKEASAARCNAMRRLMGRASLQIPALGRRISSAFIIHGRVGKVSTKQCQLPWLALIQISDSPTLALPCPLQSPVTAPFAARGSAARARNWSDGTQTPNRARAVGPRAGLGYPHCKPCAGDRVGARRACSTEDGLD